MNTILCSFRAPTACINRNAEASAVAPLEQAEVVSAEEFLDVNIICPSELIMTVDDCRLS